MTWEIMAAAGFDVLCLGLIWLVGVSTWSTRHAVRKDGKLVDVDMDELRERMAEELRPQLEATKAELEEQYLGELAEREEEFARTLSSARAAAVHDAACWIAHRAVECYLENVEAGVPMAQAMERAAEEASVRSRPSADVVAVDPPTGCPSGWVG